MDRIFLDGIKVMASHGVLSVEKDSPQPFEIDIAVYGDFRAATESDRISQTVDYSLLGSLAIEVATTTRFDLIETLAQEIADRILAIDKVLEVEVTVRKMLPPVAYPLNFAGVTIRRTLG